MIAFLLLYKKRNFKMDVPYNTKDIYNVLTSPSANYEDSVYHIELIELMNYNLDAIFKERYSIILFIENPTSEIGHFVLLSHISKDKLEYFDSFGREPPDSVKKLAEINEMKLSYNTVQIQDTKSNVCAKYCLLRMQSLPSKLSDFINMLTNNKSLSADKIVMLLIKTKYE